MSKRSKKSKKGQPTTLIAIILILVVTNAATVYYFMFYQEVVPVSDVLQDISDVMENYSDYVGKTVTLLGYYIYTAGFHILVSNPLLFFNNSLGPYNHVILTGSVPSTINTTIGKRLAVRGVVEAGATDLGGGGTFHIDSFFDVHTELTVQGTYIDKQLDPYVEFGTMPPLYDLVPEKYAVLYSGGIIPSKAHSRYWNDIIYMYFILCMHGYPAENIYVVYKDGVGEDSYTPVDYPATHTSMDTVFDILAAEMGSRDTLFFYTTNHGGSGGISVWNPMDSSGALTHTQVADWLDMITCDQMIIVMEQCVSGKFISHLSAVDRVIMTACKDDEGSYACDDEGNWDEFVYHFMCALVSIPWNGDDVTVDADFNNDGYISMREAFIWAGAMDSRDETPWYNDNGNGYGYNALQVYAGSGPWPGDAVFL